MQWSRVSVTVLGTISLTSYASRLSLLLKSSGRVARLNTGFNGQSRKLVEVQVNVVLSSAWSLSRLSKAADG
jgi:hypothetical protein